MTIDEAIEHAKEVVRTCDDGQCAKDHARLADWLRELRRARMEIDLLKTVRDGFKADVQMYMAENAKLREQVTQLRDDWESERDYADQMEAKEKKAVDENDKLRELAIRMRPTCIQGKRCTFADKIYISKAMEELGIEVS